PYPYPYPYPYAQNLRLFKLPYLYKQLDGRPMSGDIGRGATRETVSFAVHLSSMSNRPPGFYQLAGGTNSYTIESLKKAGLFQSTTFPGILFTFF
ncbi:hypothetical protein EE612_027235, partial [Oryza sativa]